MESIRRPHREHTRDARLLVRSDLYAQPQILVQLAALHGVREVVQVSMPIFDALPDFCLLFGKPLKLRLSIPDPR